MVVAGACIIFLAQDFGGSRRTSRAGKSSSSFAQCCDALQGKRQRSACRSPQGRFHPRPVRPSASAEVRFANLNVTGDPAQAQPTSANPRDALHWGRARLAPDLRMHPQDAGRAERRRIGTSAVVPVRPCRFPRYAPIYLWLDLPVGFLLDASYRSCGLPTGHPGCDG